jgi:hypothetical protein
MAPANLVSRLRFVWRVPQQPYLRFATNDYSLDPRLVSAVAGGERAGS